MEGGYSKRLQKQFRPPLFLFRVGSHFWQVWRCFHVLRSHRPPLHDGWSPGPAYAAMSDGKRGSLVSNLSVRDRIANMQKRGGGKAAAAPVESARGASSSGKEHAAAPSAPTPTPAFDASNSAPSGRELKGGMLKRGGTGALLAMWSSRHVVLYSDPVLCFFDDPLRGGASMTPRGPPFKLTRWTRVQPTAGLEGSIEAQDEPNCKPRTLKLKATSKEEAQGWWTAIQLAVHDAFPPEVASHARDHACDHATTHATTPTPRPHRAHTVPAAAAAATRRAARRDLT
jgi:hypothetical protein